MYWRRFRAWVATIHWFAVFAVGLVAAYCALSLAGTNVQPLAWAALVTAILSTKET